MRRLANPASLPHIRVKPGQRLYFSKRDAASFFDALEAPPTLRAWFGCPGVRAGHLARELGIGLGELMSYIDDAHGRLIDGGAILFPCITSWPMGFAWSSAVAQDVSLHALIETGLPTEQILCDMHVLPKDHSELALICTDDTILIHHSKQQALSLCRHSKTASTSTAFHGEPT